MSDLTQGYVEFKNEEFKKHEQRFIDLVKNGQKPKNLFICCSDSRVVPSLITNSNPGELFIIRNIGNFVAPFKPDNDFHSTAAAIEYAVCVLQIEEIIICGHSNCGAIEYLHSGTEQPEMLHTTKWLELGKPAKDKALQSLKNNKLDYSLLEATARLSVLLQVENILTYPDVFRKYDNGKLKIHAWYYQIDTGHIDFYNKETKRYEPLQISNINKNDEIGENNE